MANAGKPQMPQEAFPAQPAEYGGSERDLLEYFRILRRRRWWVLAGLIAVVGAVSAYNYKATPIWGAQAKLLVSSATSGRYPRGVPDITTFLPNPYSAGLGAGLETQMAIIRGRPVLEEAAALVWAELEAAASQTGPDPTKNDSDPGTLARMSAGAVAEFERDYIDRLVADDRLHTRPHARSKATVEGTEFKRNYIDRLLADGRLHSRPDARSTATVEAAMLSLSAVAVPDTSIIQLRASSPDARIAHHFLNAVCAVYLADALKRTQQVATEGANYVRQQLDGSDRNDGAEKTPGARKTLADADEALKEFSEATGIFELGARTKAEVERVVALEAALLSTQTQLEANRARLAISRQQLSAEDDKVVQSQTMASNPVTDNLRQQLATLQVDLQNALKTYTDDSARVRSLQEQITAVQDQLAGQDPQVERSTTLATNPIWAALKSAVVTLQAEIRAGQAQAAATEADLAVAREELGAIPQSQMTLATLLRDRQLAETQYRMLREKALEYEHAKKAQVSGAEVLEPAVTAYARQVSPRKHLNLVMALMAGALLGLLLAIVAELMDDTYADAQAAEADIGLPLIATVPSVKVGPHEHLLYTTNDDHSFKESFLSLHSNIGFVTAGGAPRTIAITSSQPSEGKSTISTNLAIAAAQAQQKVVLVDADLRRPGLHAMFDLQQVPGLSNVLAGQNSLDECIQRVTIDEDSQLRLLTAGPTPPTPQALFDSEMMDNVLKQLSSEADLVIIDSPPLGEISDAQILGSKVEAVLLVVAQRSTRRPLLRKASALLARAGANVTGLVMNRALRSRSEYYYYRSYYGAKE